MGNSIKILRTEYWQQSILNTPTYNKIKVISDELYSAFNQNEIIEAINEVNIPRAKSHEIQEVLYSITTKLGFRSEKKGLFQDYRVSGLRPDYFLKVENNGIIFEVERGKTTRNNMDMLDLWKCHLCSHASYLFLAVPQLLQQNEKETSNNKGSREYNSVCRRLSTFFDKKTYTNVKGVVIFGY